MEPHEAAPPRGPAGAREGEFPLYVTLFSLVFVAGFLVVAVVLLSRRRRGA